MVVQSFGHRANLGEVNGRGQNMEIMKGQVSDL
jgi:hypothetical protein